VSCAGCPRSSQQAARDQRTPSAIIEQECAKAAPLASSCWFAEESKPRILRIFQTARYSPLVFAAAADAVLKIASTEIAGDSKFGIVDFLRRNRVWSQKVKLPSARTVATDIFCEVP